MPRSCQPGEVEPTVGQAGPTTGQADPSVSQVGPLVGQADRAAGQLRTDGSSDASSEHKVRVSVPLDAQPGQRLHCRHVCTPRGTLLCSPAVGPIG